ncbi:hypothetical protein [Dysgonomonas sp. HGC4]|uniref:hypothetical protein n=1 Tax=Dysgonomonas sp. HGC4 TaxID=1658009 RepID=UPI0006813450|nr:hypothetical protein [Dysgonomonas sp. HGC4]MBD8349370.1 hypothetical protein [Dysgonomonas sp. HGC4]
MILNFKIEYPWGGYTNFESKILNCVNNWKHQFTGDSKKPHSIRYDKTNRWKAGRKIHFATGARTPNYNCFVESKVISTQEIEIKDVGLEINPIIKEALTLLGVETVCHYIFEEYVPKLDIVLRKRFRVSVDKRVLSLEEINTLAKNDGFDSTHDFFRWFNQDFKGKIIHWTDLKY